ncbi:unnamed protein product [Arabis nemorensis]|uniref:Uncharacterized protein n=1 Tax=Arabis nemorensis TaxID=586526 RepID=A0A565CFR5_9BRAS|nr:unnamed protein product [Arabis nemorensis]
MAVASYLQTKNITAKSEGPSPKSSKSSKYGKSFKGPASRGQIHGLKGGNFDISHLVFASVAHQIRKIHLGFNHKVCLISIVPRNCSTSATNHFANGILVSASPSDCIALPPSQTFTSTSLSISPRKINPIE